MHPRCELGCESEYAKGRAVASYIGQDLRRTSLTRCPWSFVLWSFTSIHNTHKSPFIQYITRVHNGALVHGYSTVERGQVDPFLGDRSRVSVSDIPRQHARIQSHHLCSRPRMTRTEYLDQLDTVKVTVKRLKPILLISGASCRARGQLWMTFFMSRFPLA
jgi:hypothetical protein